MARTATRTATRTKAPAKASRRRRGNVIDLRDRPLEGYDQSYLLCRDIRHAWEVVGYFEDSVWIRRKLECSRCTTTRSDKWTPWGVRLASQYSYPEDYRLTKDITAENVREEELRRVRVYKGEDELLKSLARR